MIEPLRLSVDVACSVEHAFATWTDRIGAWWPADHTVSGAPGLVVVLEAGAGGRIYERTPRGDEYDWGEVTVWEPPARLVYQWHLRSEREDATEVEIRFTGRSDGTTRLEIEHRGWERLGAGGQDQRDRNRDGWATLLPQFQTAIERR